MSRTRARLMSGKPSACRGLFVAGTDTGVGKTLIASALVHGLAGSGLRAVGMKPVAAGAAHSCGEWLNDDVEALRAVSNVEVPRDWVNPYCFAPPVAPHIAAAEAGVTVRMDVIRRAYIRLAALSDIVIVEGVGGLKVPLGPRLNAIDIPRSLDLPVILVVGMRLGCLNHALLTVEVMLGHGLRLAGWVANRLDPIMPRFRQNVEALQHRIPAPLVGQVSHAPVKDLKRVSRVLDVQRLLDCI